jgi:phosphoglycolate phosphatase-like HAD superfamily hydrolase
VPDYLGKIIFDMDGVITEEERYWDAAALTVWELLYGKHYLGLSPGGGLPAFSVIPDSRDISSIRRVIFQRDKVIALLKQKAVNSNWDLAFLCFAFQLMLVLHELSRHKPGKNDFISQAMEKGITPELLHVLSALLSLPKDSWQPSFESFLGEWPGDACGRDLPERLALPFTGEYLQIARKTFSPFSSLWEGVRDIFQEWYLGERIFIEVYARKPRLPGKKGLIEDEKPLLDISKIRDALNKLSGKGWGLGIATGRPFSELYLPLKKMGIWNCFDADSIVTYDDVCKAEEHLRGCFSQKISLGKPHPFSFLKSYWGKKLSNKRALSADGLRPEKGRCWIVGDSMADLLAAREMGALFIGVLTGHGGVDSGDLFARAGARAVLADMTEIPRFLEVSGAEICDL